MVRGTTSTGRSDLNGEIVTTKPPEDVNILTALAENQRIVREAKDPDKRAIALAWLFHLVGDIHQPLHTVQLFTREYPNGDRGGNEVCVRVAADRAAIDLHRLWDGLITSTNNVGQLSRIATELLAKFSQVGLRELEQRQARSVGERKLRNRNEDRL